MMQYHHAMDASSHVWGLGVALAIGLLIGLERERNKRSGPMRAQAGVRTFALLALAGAITCIIGHAAMYVAGLFVTAVSIASYMRTNADDPGVTTEVAMFITFLLGILSMSSPAFSGGLGVMVAVLLASKEKLHHLSIKWLSENELHDLLILAAAAFVILPLLPDRRLDPWDAFNPRQLWFLVVAVMSVASVGYLALRALGTRLGLPIAGLASGFVSSTATIGTMAERTKETPTLTAAAASAAIISNVGTMAQLCIVTGLLSHTLLAHLVLPLLAAGGIAIIAAMLASWGSLSSRNDATPLLASRPFKIRFVAGFVALLGSIMLVSAMLRSYLGAANLPWIMAISGFADVHAAAASVAQAVSSGHIDLQQASWCVLSALTSNSLLKCVIAFIKGTRRYAFHVITGTVAVLAGFAIVLGLT
jgi:uncharacterized membrane protein (DUF4010 family)